MKNRSFLSDFISNLKQAFILIGFSCSLSLIALPILLIIGNFSATICLIAFLLWFLQFILYITFLKYYDAK